MKCINYDILAIGVNIYHLISNKNVKTCKSLPDGSPSHMHQYISRQTLFPIAELWIVKYIRYPFRAYDELAARCSAGTDSLLLKSQSTVCERFPSPLSATWEASVQRPVLKAKCRPHEAVVYSWTTIYYEAGQMWLLLCLYWSYRQERNLAWIQQLVASP